MNPIFAETILHSTQAQDLFKIADIQTLWSGYGKITRYGLNGGTHKSVVVKHVQLPEQNKHPRGWNTDLSHQRKLRSYQVETAWYQDWSQQCDNRCRVPECFAIQSTEHEVLMVLEDLDDSGFSARKTQVNFDDMHHCLSWLAHFHATFMGQTPNQLWDIGTYWHLDTRPDELAALSDPALKQAAPIIDQLLNQSPFLTLVHGDAKLANFCFSEQGTAVAAVDFQYIGGGCGMKDVAYFIGSCLYEEDCERYEKELLDSYFFSLKQALQEKQTNIDTVALEQNWRQLYPIAWTDFHRFVKGWSPGHWKIHGYSERIAREVVQHLNQSR